MSGMFAKLKGLTSGSPSGKKEPKSPKEKRAKDKHAQSDHHEESSGSLLGESSPSLATPSSTAASSSPSTTPSASAAAAAAPPASFAQFDAMAARRRSSEGGKMSPGDKMRLPSISVTLDKKSRPLYSSEDVKPVSLVIPASVFEEASAESKNVIPAPRVMNRHLSGAGRDEDHPAVSKPTWRTLLQSPLGSFLTGVRRKYHFIQLAGHKGDFLTGQAGTICKKGSDLEKAALEALMGDVLKPMVPLYYKEIKVEDDSGNEVGYLEMQDLLGSFQNPSVMDVKMGIRTFLESEVDKTSKRKDLLKKMMALDPNEPTEEEKENGITKLRYMTFREALSSSNTMAFRVEAIKLAEQEPQNDFKTMRERAEVAEVLLSYLPPKDDPKHAIIRNAFIDRLELFRSTLEQSPFFRYHELIGSSLLFIYDSTCRVGVWMIDFGKTSPTETPLNHRIKWELGNREDGYLIGLDNIIDIFRE